MDNKLIIQEKEKKSSNKLHRNATLDSTSSSIKLKKGKLSDGITPLIKITKNTSIKQILDFPVFMSLYTNSILNSEKPSNKKKSLSNRKIVLKNIKNIKIKNLLIQSQTESKKELILPKTNQLSTSRNINLNINEKTTSNNILSPIQSDIKNYLINIKKLNLQYSRNYSKPKLKKINNIKLTKFTQRNNSNLNIFKIKNFEKSNKSQTTMLDLINISEIKNKNKEYSIGNYKLNSKIKVKEIDNKLQNDNNNNKSNQKNEENKNNIIIDGNNKKLDKVEINTIERNEEIKESINKINSEIKNEKVKKLKPVINIKAKITKNSINNIDLNKENINNNIIRDKNKKLSLESKPKKSVDFQENKNNKSIQSNKSNKSNKSNEEDED